MKVYYFMGFSDENLHEKGHKAMRDLIHFFQLHLWKIEADGSFDIKAVSLSIVFMILASTGLLAQRATGKITAVIDGNTVEFANQDKRIYTVFLMGIDSPELDQEYGVEAKKFLEKLILHKDVVVHFKGKDGLGNPLALVMINGQSDPRVELLKEGLAWTAEENPSDDLEPYKTFAKRKGRGLWKQENPVPPWTYRKKQRMSNPKHS